MPEQASGQDGRNELRVLEGGGLERVLGARVPAWLLLVVLVLAAAGTAATLVVRARSAVHLGPAVGVAQAVEMHVTLCNRDVDRRHINPRVEELDLEKVLRKRGADSADVVIDRHDCPGPAPAAATP